MTRYSHIHSIVSCASHIQQYLGNFDIGQTQLDGLPRTISLSDVSRYVTTAPFDDLIKTTNIDSFLQVHTVKLKRLFCLQNLKLLQWHWSSNITDHTRAHSFCYYPHPLLFFEIWTICYCFIAT